MLISTDKFFQKVSMILTAPDCWTFSEYNGISIAFFMLSIIGKSSPWQSIFCKSRTEKSDWRRKPVLFQHCKHGAGCLHLAWKLRSCTRHCYRGIHFQSVKRGLTVTGESPGSSSLWAVMTTTGLWPRALDTCTHCMAVVFVTNSLPSADSCPLPMLLPVQKTWEVISTRQLIRIAELMVLFLLVEQGFFTKEGINWPFYEWPKIIYHLLSL